MFIFFSPIQSLYHTLPGLSTRRRRVAYLWGKGSVGLHPGNSGQGDRGDPEVRRLDVGQESAGQHPHPQTGGSMEGFLLQSIAVSGLNLGGQRQRPGRRGAHVPFQSSRLQQGLRLALVHKWAFCGTICISAPTSGTICVSAPLLHLVPMGHTR